MRKIIAASNWYSIRYWFIGISLFWLHLRFLGFHTSRLDLLRRQGVPSTWWPLPSLTDSELVFANCWNQRISRVLTRVNAPYARCMKRCYVLTILLTGRRDLDFVIGVMPGMEGEGHAWLEQGGKVIADSFDREKTPFHEIMRFSVNSEIQ